LLVLCISFSVPAQNITGTIVGTVRDGSGAVMPNTPQAIYTKERLARWEDRSQCAAPDQLCEAFWFT
jgi:hypothetical protein